MKDKVYEVVKRIPEGKIATYGQIELYLGNLHLARAVGNALHNNPDPALIPCHRVVNAKGKVAEHYAFGGADAQRKRLEAEGIEFDANGRIDLNKYGWEVLKIDD